MKGRPVMKTLMFPLTIGVAGLAVLISLGVWQVQRLSWKEQILADINYRIAAAPSAIPASPDSIDDLYLPVSATGTFAGDPLRVLVSVKIFGAGHRLISVFETGGRRILVDRGYLRLQETTETPSEEVTIVGNLHWPQDADSFTPDPDGDLWFARDVTAMADRLGTEPILIVARELSPAEKNVTPLPVDTNGIPNDHLEYAITWFSLAFIWILMTGYWIWRNRTNKSQAKAK